MTFLVAGSKLMRWTYTVAESFSTSRIGPRIKAEANAPTRMAICCSLGVEPIRNPVFKSCDVVPPFEDAMQTMPPIESAVM